MTNKQVRFLAEACDYCGVECEVYHGYSGRFMYGQTTEGLVVESLLDVLAAVAHFVATFDEEDLQEVPPLNGLRQDQLGLKIIFY